MDQGSPKKMERAIKYDFKNQKSKRPILTFAVLSGLLLLPLHLGVEGWFGRGSSSISVGIFVVICVIALRGLWQDYPHKVLGACNWVTLIRAALTAALAAAIFSIEPNGWLVFWVSILTFSMDGVDGWLARRSGLSSDFGARFDMEIDALLGAILALMLITHGHVGLEILVLGFTRYLFVAASLVIPKLKGSLPESFRRKTVCVVQIAALIILLCPLTPVTIMAPTSIGAAILLIWSFAIDTLWLLRVPE